MLEEDAKRLFTRLGVFAGSFSLEAAETVVAAELDVLGALVDLSLLKQMGEDRFLMLETIREFALEWLDASAEVDVVRGRHAEHFLALAERSEAELIEGRWTEWLDRLDADRMNFAGAIEWAERTAAGSVGLRLVLALRHFWEARGYLDEGSLRFEKALDDARATPEQRLVILSSAAIFAYGRGEFRRAAALLEERLTLARTPLTSGAKDQLRLVDTLRLLGGVEIQLGDLQRARQLLEESVALAEGLPSEYARSRMLATAELGHALLSDGRYQEAVHIFEETLTFCRERGDTLVACNDLLNMGSAELRSGRPAAAACLREGVKEVHEMGYPEGVMNCLAVLGAVAAHEGRLRRAAIMFGACEALRRMQGYSLQRIERELNEEATILVRSNLGEARFERLFAEGTAMQTDAGVAYAAADLD